MSKLSKRSQPLYLLNFASKIVSKVCPKFPGLVLGVLRVGQNLDTIFSPDRALFEKCALRRS